MIPLLVGQGKRLLLGIGRSLGLADVGPLPAVPIAVITSPLAGETQASPIPITITFNLDWLGFIAPMVQIGNGQMINFVSVDAHTYTFDVLPILNKLITVTVPAGVVYSVVGIANPEAVFRIVYGALPVTGVALTAAFLADLGDRRGRPSPGHNSVWFLERFGATIVQPTAFEPDPATHRDDYYYNATTNALYKKVVSRREPGIVVAHWQKMST